MTTVKQGFILHTFPFEDYHQIISLFTRDEGVIKAVYKYALNGKKSAATPLTLVETTVREGRSDLYQCAELTLMNHLSGLRERYPILSAAGRMVESLQQVVLPRHPLPALFDLFSVYLHALCLDPVPERLAASFRLKLLKHEGLLDPMALSDPLLVLAYSLSLKEIALVPWEEALDLDCNALWEKLLQG